VELGLVLMAIVGRIPLRPRFSSKAKWASGRYDRAGVEMNSTNFESIGYQIQQNTGISKVSP
jgi:hypothetical protein